MAFYQGGAVPMPAPGVAPNAAAAFNALDRNHDGVITREEFNSALGGGVPGSATVTRGMAMPAPAVVQHTTQATVAAASTPNVHRYSVNTAASAAVPATAVMQPAKAVMQPATAVMQPGATVVQQPPVHTHMQAATVNAGASACAAFNALDRNHDGVITREEFESALGAPAQPPVTTYNTAAYVTTGTKPAGSMTLAQPPPVTYAAPPTMVQQVQAPVTYAAPPVTTTVAAPPPQVVTYTAPAVQAAPTVVKEQIVVNTPPPPPPKVIVQEQPIVYAAPPAPEVILSPQVVERRIEPVRTYETTVARSLPPPSRQAVVGERVIGERPISREELAANGNLVEGPPQQAPSIEDRRLTSRAVVDRYVEPIRTVERAVPIRTAAVERVPLTTARLETVQTYAAPAVVPTTAPLTCQAQAVPVQVQTAPLIQSVQAPVTYAAPAAATYVETPAMYTGAQMYYEPGVKTYAAPAVTTMSAFDALDRNHDGVIDRAELAAALRGPVVGSPYVI